MEMSRPISPNLTLKLLPWQRLLNDVKRGSGPKVYRICTQCDKLFKIIMVMLQSVSVCHGYDFDNFDPKSWLTWQLP